MFTRLSRNYTPAAHLPPARRLQLHASVYLYPDLDVFRLSAPSKTMQLGPKLAIKIYFQEKSNGTIRKGCCKERQERAAS